MRISFYTISCSILILLLGSCGGSREIAVTEINSSDLPASNLPYVEEYKVIAVEEMHRAGIPASITLAQGILESNHGKSYLATDANNHFGIKCHSDWKGKRVFKDDDAKDECFRKYRNAEESFVDHSDFLKTRRRYAFLFELDKDDYKGWAKGLKNAGYATNPKYASLLIQLVERHDLHVYDKVTLTKVKNPSVATKDKNGVFYYNRIKTVKLKHGESLSDISKKHDIPVNRLLKYNDLKKGENLMAGQHIFLQPKRKQGLEKYHIVQKGETMYLISQKHGIQLEWLYMRNKMSPPHQPATGQRLWLQRERPDTPELAKFPPRLAKADSRNFIYYTVKKGDTLYSIAIRHSLSVEELRKVNDLGGSAISPGDKLIVGYKK